MSNSRVRTDRGGENVLIGEYMLQTRGIGRNSIIMARVSTIRELNVCGGTCLQDASASFITCFINLKLIDYLMWITKRFLYTAHCISSKNSRTTAKFSRRLGSTSNQDRA